MVIWYWLRFIAMRLAMVVKAVGSAELRFRFGTRGSGTKVPIETAQMISAVWSAPLERTVAFAQERICLASLSPGIPWAVYGSWIGGAWPSWQLAEVKAERSRIVAPGDDR